MYLFKKRYVTFDEREALKLKGVAGVDAKRVNEISEEVGYWRKANAIHQWFVDQVQGGDDECRPFDVSVAQLRELLDLTNQVLAASELTDGIVNNGYHFKDGERTPITESGKVIKDPTIAQELLPTQSGFFFGSTDYDQYYIEDLELTKEILTAALDDMSDDDYGTHFEYYASW